MPRGYGVERQFVSATIPVFGGKTSLFPVVSVNSQASIFSLF